MILVRNRSNNIVILVREMYRVISADDVCDYFSKCYPANSYCAHLTLTASLLLLLLRIHLLP